MATTRLPGPLGCEENLALIDCGTLCRTGSFAPGTIGLFADRPLSVARVEWPSDQEVVVAAAVAAKVDVDKYLQALGKPGAPPMVRERVERAAEYFETRFPRKKTTEIVDYLRAIDFSLEVRAIKLAAIAPVGSTLIQNVASGRPGNFFTKPGYATDRLGIAAGSRLLQRFRVISGSAEVLVSTAAPISDTWTPGRTRNVYTPMPSRQPWQPPGRAGELVGGGGLQVVIPDPINYYLVPLENQS